MILGVYTLCQWLLRSVNGIVGTPGERAFQALAGGVPYGFMPFVGDAPLGVPRLAIR